MRQYGHSLPLPFPNTTFDVVVIGASLGGITALSQILSALPADFPAAILIVQHLSRTSRSSLDEILGHRTALRVKWAEQGEKVCPGIIYLAPPNYHVQVCENGVLTLSQSDPVQFARPSVNPLFESVAKCYRERCIAVVLTGMGKDGTQGVRAIKAQGGRVFVQDQPSSQAFSMPQSAFLTGCVDFMLPLPMIAHALISLVMVKGAATLFQVTKASFGASLAPS